MRSICLFVVITLVVPGVLGKCSRKDLTSIDLSIPTILSYCTESTDSDSITECLGEVLPEPVQQPCAVCISDELARLDQEAIQCDLLCQQQGGDGCEDCMTSLFKLMKDKCE
jgi:hypothetical protein